MTAEDGCTRPDGKACLRYLALFQMKNPGTEIVSNHIRNVVNFLLKAFQCLLQRSTVYIQVAG